MLEGVAAEVVVDPYLTPLLCVISDGIFGGQELAESLREDIYPQDDIFENSHLISLT